MNHHLNIFRFFDESIDKVFIENNLSRAFSICLANSSILLNQYIQSIVTEEDYEYLFSSISEDTKCEIDIQVNTATIDKESFSRIYAVAMTTDNDLVMDDFFKQHTHSNKRNITDVIITIKDIAIIVEVKRTGEDCKAQLYNQVLPFINENCNVIPKNFAWQKIIKLMEKIKNLQLMESRNSVFIPDFLQLSAIRFPEWFEPKPFNVLSFSSQLGSPNFNQLAKRMKQAFSASKYELLGYSDRLGVSVPFGWVNEISSEFYTDTKNAKDYIAFYIYPGNTKQQGYQIFNKPLSWLNKRTLSIDNNEYKLKIVSNVKFCHFNRYISDIRFNDEDLIKPLHTLDNFKKSGKWKIDNWNNFEDLMDKHFKPELKWRERCKWKENFKNTDRTYFTMSLGFVVSLCIPFDKFKEIDKQEEDIKKISEFVDKVADAFETLII